MALPVSGPQVGHAESISIECGYCGHSRWIKPAQLFRYGITDETPLTQLGARMSCHPCQADGLPGKNIVITAAFVTDELRQAAHDWQFRNLIARESGSHAKRA